MPTQIALHPADVAVALRLEETPGATYLGIASDLGISSSTAFAAVARLAAAGLVRADERHINRHALLEFLEHGVRYAFPGTLGTLARGVPTAHAAPFLAKEIVGGDPVVWPDPHGSMVGVTLSPLLPQAIQLPLRCPGVYEMLTLIDAIRIGRARERSIARGRLRQRLGAVAA